MQSALFETLKFFGAQQIIRHCIFKNIEDFLKCPTLCPLK